MPTSRSGQRTPRPNGETGPRSSVAGVVSVAPRTTGSPSPMRTHTARLGATGAGAGCSGRAPTGCAPESPKSSRGGLVAPGRLLRRNVGRHLDLPVDQLLEGAIRERALETGGDLRVPADQVTVPWLFRADRLVDHLRDLLRCDAAARGLGEDLLHAVELLPIEARFRRRHAALLIVDGLGPLAPDRGVDAARLDHRHVDRPRCKLLAQ